MLLAPPSAAASAAASLTIFNPSASLCCRCPQWRRSPAVAPALMPCARLLSKSSSIQVVLVSGAGGLMPSSADWLRPRRLVLLERPLRHWSGALPKPSSRWAACCRSKPCWCSTPPPINMCPWCSPIPSLAAFKWVSERTKEFGSVLAHYLSDFHPLLPSPNLFLHHTVTIKSFHTLHTHLVKSQDYQVIHS